MPKLLFIVPHLSNSTRLLADYLRHLDRSFEVTLFALEDDLTLDTEFPPEAKRIILKPASKLVHALKTIWCLFRATKDQDLIVSWVELTPTYLAALVARLRRIPLIGWLHTHVGAIFDLNMRPTRLHEPMIRRIYPKLAATVGCSEGVAADFRERFNVTNAIAIPNGIDLDRVRTVAGAPLPEQYRHIFVKPTIACVGTLHPLKNPQQIIRMHAALRKEGIDHHVFLAGTGPLRRELEELARELGVPDSFFFLGFVENPYPLIKHSTAFVLTSRLEGFALVLAEALALGVPVVAADCPVGPREVLCGGKYGLLVARDNFQALIDAMRSILIDPQQRERLRQAALAGAERHSIIPRARQMEDLFRRVLATGALDSAALLAQTQQNPE